MINENKKVKARAGGEGGVNPIGNEWGILNISEHDSAVRMCAFMIGPLSNSGSIRTHQRDPF